MNKEKIVSVVVVLLVLGAIGYGVFGMKKPATTPVVANVAMVNGVAITQTVYDAQLQTTIASFKQQGLDTEKPENLKLIREQVLNDLIGNELVMQEINKLGLKATVEEVNAQFQAVLTQAGGADKLNAELVKANITEAQFKENIARQIVIQKYLTQNIDTSSIKVTAAEIEQFYKDNGGGAEGSPKLADVKAQIEQQLIANKQQVLVANFVAALRAKAAVEVLLK
jgi:hypothetical protein